MLSFEVARAKQWHRHAPVTIFGCHEESQPADMTLWDGWGYNSTGRHDGRDANRKRLPVFSRYGRLSSLPTSVYSAAVGRDQKLDSLCPRCLSSFKTEFTEHLRDLSVEAFLTT